MISHLALILAAALAVVQPSWGHASTMRHARRHHLHEQIGKASYYGPRHAHPRTASGKRLHAGALTAASRTLPLGARAKVTNLKTGKSVHVVVTDRGPFARHRIIDLSRAAAVRLGMKHDGVATVAVKPTVLPEASG